MKRAILILLTSAFVPTICLAQFNTIGDVNSHRVVITKRNPLEQIQTPMDSIQEDITSVNPADEMDRKEDRIRQYLSVSFPLKKYR